MARARQNRRRGVPRRAVATVARRVSHIDTGVQFQCSSDQPPWTAAPWWPLTAVTNATAKSTTFSFKTIHALVLTSLGVTTASFNIRVLTVRAWGLDKQPITMTVYGSGSKCSTLAQINDRGSFMHYSRLAWRFGKASFSTLDTGCASDDTNVFKLDQASGKTSVYLQLLIQPATVPVVTLYRGLEEPLPSYDTVDSDAVMV